MLLSDITNLGDKIDIQLVQQLEQLKSGQLSEPIRTYKSSLFDYLNDKEIEIAMPTENGRMVLFQVGLRCRMLFYTKKGLYTCFATVQKRYKKDNFFMLQMLVVSDPVKFQRREFFRVESMIDMKYIRVPRAFAEYPTTESVFEHIQELGYVENQRKGITLDISGGGIRFVSDERMEPESFILIIIRLTNDKIDQTFYLVTEMIDSIPSPKVSGKFISRGKFLFKDLKDREGIVRYVFEEERRIRRKEMGS
ncbi:MAG: flagellar brake protein [Lachnospiraceae bacterium]|nr:flagellar brake protein [Lachnospiraceae bacterium]